MIKNLKTLVAGLLLGIATTATADNYSYLTVTSQGGDASYELGSISKITFDAENMILWKNNSEQLAALPLATLGKMAFTAESAGILSLQTSGSGITIAGGVLRVQAKAGSRITLYDMKGAAVKQVVASAEETEISLSGMTKGVYIVRVGDEARKVMNK